eukprot:1845571-Karenia_brevis.AAC.1
MASDGGIQIYQRHSKCQARKMSGITRAWVVSPARFCVMLWRSTAWPSRHPCSGRSQQIGAKQPKLD